MEGISHVGRKRSKVVLPRYIDNSDFWLHPDIYNTLNNLPFVLLSYLDHYHAKIITPIYVVFPT